MSTTDTNDKQIHSLLVIGAIEAEISEIQYSLPKLSSKVFHGRQLSVQTALCGVGSLESAIFLQQFLNDHKPDEMVFFGSAGAYKPDESLIGQMCMANQFFQKDIVVLEERAKIPEIMLTCIELESGLVAQHCQKSDLFLKEIQVNSTNSVTLDTVINDQGVNNTTGPLLENLEAFGLAMVAKKHQLPLTAFLAVTNLVNTTGSSAWFKNYVRMGRELNIRFLDALEITS